MLLPEHHVRVAIVGGGPIGLELAAGLREAGVEAVVLEAGAIGSTIGWWAPETQFFSSPERIEIAGVPLASVDQSKATRERYLAYLRAVASQFELDVRTFTRVAHVARRGDGFELLTVPSHHGVGGPEELRSPFAARVLLDRSAMRWRAEIVVLAIGDMHRPRLLGVPGEELPHVSHYFCDPHLTFRQRVLVVGGKNSAVEAAIRMHRVGAHVTISYRGSEFDSKRVKYWLKPELDWLVKHGKIRFHPRTVVRAITPEWVELGSIDDRAGGVADEIAPDGIIPNEIIELPADRVLLLTGYVQDPELFTQLGVELVGDERAPRHDPRTMETNVPGLFVAGTAVGGSQRRTKVYIETSHEHVDRIVRRLSGVALPWIREEDRARYATLEES